MDDKNLICLVMRIYDKSMRIFPCQEETHVIRLFSQVKERNFLSGVITILIALSIALSSCQPAATSPEAVLSTSTSGVRATETLPPTHPPTEPPTAMATLVLWADSITVTDQEIINGEVGIAEAVINGSGWVVIHADAGGKPGPVVGYVQLGDGVNQNLKVPIDLRQATETLYAMLHSDGGYSGMWEQADDAPVMVDGNPVMAPFMVTGGLAEAPTPTTEFTSGEVTIKIADSSFIPNKIRVKVGTKVTWVHEGRRYHTVTADDGSFNSGQLAGGEAFSFTFTQVGVYAYYCEIHGGSGGQGMAGVVEVTE